MSHVICQTKCERFDDGCCNLEEWHEYVNLCREEEERERDWREGGL